MDTGGPAFPENSTAYDGTPVHYPGMNLRDWFAGQFLAGAAARQDCLSTRQGMTASEMRSDIEDQIMGQAYMAYKFADAMLAERAKERQ